MKNLFEAKQELNKFLEEHPHLKPLQAEIDAMLKGATNQHNKIVLLKSMLEDKVNELNKLLKELIDSLNRMR